MWNRKAIAANLRGSGRSLAATGLLALALLPGKSAAVSQGNPVDMEIWIQMPISVTLDAALATYAATASTGQSFTVTMTVTNNGTVMANNVRAALWKTPASTAGVSVAGPAPASANVPAGGMTVFSWTVDANTIGSIAWSGTATADGPVSSAVAGSAAGTVVRAANLVARVTVNPNNACAGQSYDVVVTVSNTGSAAAEGFSVRPFRIEGAATDNAAGAVGSPPVSLAGGTGQSFTWVYTAAGAAGMGTYSTTATGDDANAKTPVLSNVSAATVSEAGAAVLEGIVATVPSTVSTGQTFQVRFTVTNTGGTNATGVVPKLAADAGVTYVSGPAPASVATLGPGENRTFAWQYTASAVGAVNFTATVDGDDCNASAITDSAGGAVTILAAANLVATMWLDTSLLVAGATVTATMTVTNTGAAAANGVVPVLGIAGVPVTPSGPVPASASIAGGGNAVFVWTFVATGPGTGNFTGGVSGTDALSGLVVSSAGITSPDFRSLAPATIAPSIVLTSVGAVAIGRTVTATVTLVNTGEDAATLAVTHTVTGAGTLGNASVASPVPVVIAGGGTQSVAWSYIPVSCGTSSIDVGVAGIGSVSGVGISPAAASQLVTVVGQPFRVVGRANVGETRVGNLVDLTFEVWDDCPSPNRLPGESVSIVVVTGGGSVTPGGGVTDGNGEVRTLLRVGREPGMNIIRGDVETAPSPSGTVVVEGTIPDAPEGYLTQNTFNPRVDTIQIRTFVPHPLRLSVRIYNVAGQLVRLIGDQQVPAGLTAWEWDGRNDSGALVGNGMYFIQIVSGSNTQIRRVIVLKR